MMGWRRNPPGKGYQALVSRRETLNPALFRRNFGNMTEEEFVEAMQMERASEKMIARDLEVFRAIKARTEESTRRRRRARKDRKGMEVIEELAGYADIEKRRHERGEMKNEGDI